MKVQGRDCTLTIAKDNNYIPLPFSEETVRTASKGYALPGSIGLRNREKVIKTGKALTGCVVKRLLKIFSNEFTKRLMLAASEFEVFAKALCKCQCRK